MIHARTDYNRIQDPAVSNPELATGGTPIAADEPVFLIRGKDACAGAALRAWADRLMEIGGDMETAEHVRMWAVRMEQWQISHGGKTPDTPGHLLAGDRCLQPHQQRVVDEKIALDEKISKLTTFTENSLFLALPFEEQERMARQLEAMTTYGQVLEERISAF